MIKRILFIGILILNLVLAENVIKIGIEGSYPPFSYITPDQKIEGFEPDLAKLFCEKINKKCEIIQTDFDALIPSLNVKKIDAILASMSITDERRKAINFTNKYYQTPARFIAVKESGFEITKEGLKGKTIGVQSGTIHEIYLNDNYKNISKIRSYRNLDDGIYDLESGRIDLVFADIVAADTGYLQNEYGESLEFIGPEFSDKKWFGEGVGIGIRKEDTELVDLFNEAIRKSREDGSYKEIEKRYFDYDVYGDDN